MKSKRILSVIAAAAIAVTLPFSAAGCGKDADEQPDGLVIADMLPTEATPVNTYTYDVPQDFCRTYYEVFVRSFSDGDGDGIGDFKGLKNNLDYLNDGNDATTTDLGINGIWMMPINKANSYHKYDVVDYYDVDPEYGTLEDFEELVAACEERGIWLQMDLVINHTSDQHPWYQEALRSARQGNDPETDYALSRYDIVKSDKNPGGYTKLRDNSGEIDGYWVYCAFPGSMVDLNLSSKAMRDEIEDIVEFWLEEGIRSFRLDAVPWACATGVSYTEKNSEFWTWFNEMCNKKAKALYEKKHPGAPEKAVYCYNVGEVLTDSRKTIEDYFKTKMSAFSFNFSMHGSGGFTHVARRTSIGDACDLVNNMATMQTNVSANDPNAIMSNLLSNHDMDRSSTTDPVVMKVAAGLYILSPGNPYIYYGEEIGAMGSRGAAATDANRRLHFNWGDTSKGVTKDPPGTDFKKEQTHGTWKSQTTDPASLLTYYRSAIQLRNRFPEIGRGTLTPYALDGDGKLTERAKVTSPKKTNELNKRIAAYKLEHGGEDVIIVHNTDTATVSILMTELAGYKVEGMLIADKGGVIIRDGKLDMSGCTVAVLKKSA